MDLPLSLFRRKVKSLVFKSNAYFRTAIIFMRPNVLLLFSFGSCCAIDKHLMVFFSLNEENKFPFIEISLTLKFYILLI